LSRLDNDKLKKILIAILKILTAAVFIFFIIYSVNLQEIRLALLNADYRLFAAAAFFGLLNITIQFFRWNFIVYLR
jgi:hypothetical protein